jgi:hypothetical protein
VFSPKIALHVRNIASGCEPAPLARGLPAPSKRPFNSAQDREATPRHGGLGFAIGGR